MSAMVPSGQGRGDSETWLGPWNPGEEVIPGRLDVGYGDAGEVGRKGESGGCQASARMEFPLTSMETGGGNSFGGKMGFGVRLRLRCVGG